MLEIILYLSVRYIICRRVISYLYYLFTALCAALYDTDAAAMCINGKWVI
jgi:hypothetical protein